MSVSPGTIGGTICVVALVALLAVHGCHKEEAKRAQPQAPITVPAPPPPPPAPPPSVEPPKPTFSFPFIFPKPRPAVATKPAPKKVVGKPLVLTPKLPAATPSDGTPSDGTHEYFKYLPGDKLEKTATTCKSTRPYTKGMTEAQIQAAAKEFNVSEATLKAATTVACIN